MGFATPIEKNVVTNITTVQIAPYKAIDKAEFSLGSHHFPIPACWALLLQKKIQTRLKTLADDTVDFRNSKISTVFVLNTNL